MKKLTIIGAAVAALAGPLAQGAWAMPADMTPLVQSQPVPAQRLATQPVFGPTQAEQRADTLRSEALNRKYGLGVESLTLERPANDRFAADNPTRGDLVRLTPSTGSPTTFQWGAAGIGAGVLLGVVLLIGAGFFEIRHHERLRTS